MTLYELIKNGFDRDTIVYDIDAKGRLTKRLICLLIGHAQTNGVTPTKFFIDVNQLPEIMNFLPYTESWPELVAGNSYTLFGIEIEFVYGLDSESQNGNPYMDFFKKMGGSLPSFGRGLVVLASKDKAILGCY